MNFIFDVDGTLTPSRQPINDTFKRWFLEFCYSHKVYLVTGSDYPKTYEQLGHSICINVEKVYNCNGNDVWKDNQNIYTSDWKLKGRPHEWLSEQLTLSTFPLRTGLHFEHRPGMVNFSIIGRNATPRERSFYVEWDTDHNERDNIAKEFNLIFTDLEARPGGETGIDIGPIGSNKSQILKDFDPNSGICFFGDRMDEYGNDYPLAKQILDNNLGKCYNIQNWQETWEILKTL